MNPSVCPFDQPPVPITPQPSAVVSSRLYPVAPVRNDGFEPGGVNLVSQRVRVMSFVSDHRRAERHLDGDILQRRHQQILFGDIRAGRGHPQRQTGSIDDDLQLHTFANLGFSDLVAPFFARMKVASANNCSKSNWPSSSSCPIRMAWISAKTPSPAHSWSRRQQVVSDGKSPGRSCQRAPVRSSHNRPSKHSRSSSRGRPPFGDGGCTGK